MKAAQRIGTVAAAAALAFCTCGSALAAGSGGTPAPSASATGRLAQGKLDTAKALAAARIQGRLVTLRALSLVVDGSKYLASSEKSTLSNQISADLSGLTALATKMSNESTVDAVHADETAMVDDYRVYLLMVPQVRLTDALAAESDAAATLQKAYDALKQLLASQSGGGTAQQQAELAGIESEVSSAQSAIGNSVSGELAISPGPDQSAIEAALAPARQAAKAAHSDLAKARDDAESLRASLK